MPPGTKKQKANSFSSRVNLAHGLSARLGTVHLLIGPPLSSVDGHSSDLLDVVQTAGVGFEDGRVVEHLIEGDAQKDYVELKDTATPTLG